MLPIILLFIVAAAAIIFTRLIMRRRNEENAARERAARAEARFAETLKFIAEIEKSGTLPSLEAPELNLRRDEFVVMRESGVVMRGKTPRMLAAAAAELKFADVTLFSGPLTPAADIAEPLATGTLYLTNARLVFTSDRSTISTTLSGIVSITGALDSFRLTMSNAEAPADFRVQAPMLWPIMIKWMCSAEPRSPRLDSGARITLVREVTGVEWRLVFELNSDGRQVETRRT